MDAGKAGEYLSRDDFRNRTKAGAAIVDNMIALGLLDGLPESNQMSLMDFFS